MNSTLVPDTFGDKESFSHNSFNNNNFYARFWKEQREWSWGHPISKEETWRSLLSQDLPQQAHSSWIVIWHCFVMATTQKRKTINFYSILFLLYCSLPRTQLQQQQSSTVRWNQKEKKVRNQKYFWMKL